MGEHKSELIHIICGVPQGSSLRPWLFNFYMLPLGHIIHDNYVTYHSYTDETQVYLARSLNGYGPLDSLFQCLEPVDSWILQGNMEIMQVPAQLESRGILTKPRLEILEF